MFGHYKKEQLTLWRRLLKAFRDLINKIKRAKKPDDVSNALNEFMDTKAFRNEVDGAYKSMINYRRVDSAKSWRQAAAQFGNSKQIFQGLRNEMKGPVGIQVNRLIEQNAQLIKTLPRNWALRATKIAQEQFLKGKRPEQVLARLQKQIPAGMSKNLKLIARTQVAKAGAALTQVRAQRNGIHCYIWRSCKDERVRIGHSKMDGVLVFYRDPPSPQQVAGQKSYGKYHAGCTFNCRCHQQPVIKLQWLPDQVRVFQDGSIRTMSKAQIMAKYQGRTR